MAGPDAGREGRSSPLDRPRRKAELARNRIDREEIQRDVREAMKDVKIDQEELRRDLAEAREEIDRAMREVDAHAADIRRSGQDPEQIKAQIRASLKSGREYRRRSHHAAGPGIGRPSPDRSQRRAGRGSRSPRRRPRSSGSKLSSDDD